MTRLILLGAGGLARETLEAAVAAGDEVVGVLDDDPGMRGRTIGGVTVTGGVDQYGLLGLGVAEARPVVAMASSSDPGRRRRVAGRFGVAGPRWGEVVHPTVSLGRSVRIGPGAILLAYVVATADVGIGAHVAVMPGCILTHDVRLGDGCTLAAGVKLAGGVTVGEDAYLGAGALVREGLTIGAGAVVGMGAVVTRDVPPGETWAGVPARELG